MITDAFFVMIRYRSQMVLVVTMMQKYINSTLAVYYNVPFPIQYIL